MINDWSPKSYSQESRETKIYFPSLTWSKEYFRKPKLEVIVVKPQRLEKRLAEKARIQSGQTTREEGFVAIVQILKRGPRWITLTKQMIDKVSYQLAKNGLSAKRASPCTLYDLL